MNSTEKVYNVELSRFELELMHKHLYLHGLSLMGPTITGDTNGFPYRLGDYNPSIEEMAVMELASKVKRVLEEIDFDEKGYIPPIELL